MTAFTGLSIVTSLALTKSSTVRRSWRERLFSWPWQPLRSVRTIQIPDRTVYFIGDTIHCHPAVLSQLQAELKERKGDDE